MPRRNGYSSFHRGQGKKGRSRKRCRRGYGSARRTKWMDRKIDIVTARQTYASTGSDMGHEAERKTRRVLDYMKSKDYIIDYWNSERGSIYDHKGADQVIEYSRGEFMPLDDTSNLERFVEKIKKRGWHKYPKAPIFLIKPSERISTTDDFVRKSREILSLIASWKKSGRTFKFDPRLLKA